MRSKFILTAIFAVLVLAQPAPAQTGATRTFRGSVAGKHVQMVLTINGGKVEGKYTYDNVGQDIKLTGSVAADGKLELTEYAEKGKPSGKFLCKGGLDNPI